ncbi:MAG: hypothetical protein JNJ45_08805 [Chthonomonas sp.]|nr:hypothetical protein [Chthonomonas sp.]
MAKWTEGDKVKIVKREPTMDDRLSNSYFEHMGGLVGIVQSVYSETEVAVKIDLDSLSKVSSHVHAEATRRLRAKFIESTSEEGRSRLSAEEKNFIPNYVLLVREDDLQKA